MRIEVVFKVEIAFFTNVHTPISGYRFEYAAGRRNTISV